MAPASILLSEPEIARRVVVLGAEISGYYRQTPPTEDPPVILGIMNGALFFLTDLLRALDLEMEISCVRLASYTDTKSTGILRGLEALGDSFAGRRVLVVDDILDTGLTLDQLTRRLRELGATEIKICVLLQKRHGTPVPIRADWVGFEIVDEFVVGYGLDYNGLYRGLRHICIMK
jgi:hypoxanthine phosphoribosyltransferase